MVVIGLAAVIMSFKMTDKSEDKGENLQNEKDDLVSVENTDELYNQLEKKIEDRAEEMLDRTDDKLSEISNEKIMGLSEYSQQLFDKLEKNHEETVFMYNMLNEKEKELKELIHSADSTKADISNEVTKKYHEMREQLEEAEEMRKKIEVQFVESFPERSSVYDDEIARIEQAEKAGEMFEDSGEDKVVENVTEKEILENETIENKNDEIIALYKKGRTVLEISKMLSLGQGEVKFVIDLYNAR